MSAGDDWRDDWYDPEPSQNTSREVFEIDSPEMLPTGILNSQGRMIMKKNPYRKGELGFHRPR